MDQPTVQIDDKSGLLDCFVWLFFVTAILGVIAQTVTKLVVRRLLGPEDYLILFSLSCLIGQSASVAVQTSNGLGKHLGSLGSDQITKILKAEYAGNILLILCLGFAKLSLLTFINTLAVAKLYRYVVYLLGAFTILWTVASLLVVGFQCSLPRPWEYTTGRCIDRLIFFNFYGIFNILTDLGPVILMIFITSQIQTSMKRKITIAGVFACRIVVIAAVVVQLYFLNRAGSTLDPTFDLWPTWICTLLVQSLAVVTACIPYLKPFMDSLESGGFRADDQRRKGQIYGSYNPYGSGKSDVKARTGGAKTVSARSNHSHNNFNGHKNGSAGHRIHHNRHENQSHELGLMKRLGNPETSHGANIVGGATRDDDDDTNSQSSHARIIKETRTFTVNVEPKAY